MLDWRRLRERAFIDVLRWTPKGLFSRAMGWAARRAVPAPIRRPLYGGFARRYGVNLEELDRPLGDFPTFDAFFTRPLPGGARPIEGEEHDEIAVSPCDGVLSEHGVSEGGRMIQCKGLDYSVRSLLGDEEEARAFEGGAYVTIYLAPRHYHRVHSPAGHAVTGYRHLPGAFFPVNPPSVAQVSELFAINERLITYLDGPLGRVAVVMVAAMGVGHMTVSYDSIESHRSREGSARTYPVPRPLAKGAELGTFHLGSTVVLLFQPGKVVVSSMEQGRPMRLGETLGRRVSGRSGEVAA